MSKSAGIIIIGNEVLSGKTQDINSYFLCTELRQLGVEVQKISTIQDEIPLIGNFFKRTQRQDSKTELLVFITPARLVNR